MSVQSRGLTLLIIGASGLVGRHTLDLALSDVRIEKVIAPTRKKLPEHPKLYAPQLEFERLDEMLDWGEVNAVICAVGTTMRRAGSQSAFHAADHGYPLAVAKLARENNVSTYVLTSAIGAKSDSSFFYNRVKGQLESDLIELGFGSLSLVRPSVIDGQRSELRLGERLLIGLLKLFGPLLPQRWKLNPAIRIAEFLIDSAVSPKPGINVICSAELT